MIRQQWFVVGASALITGTLASFVTPSQVATAIMATVGAIGSSALIQAEDDRRRLEDKIDALETKVQTFRLSNTEKSQRERSLPRKPSKPSLTSYFQNFLGRADTDAHSSQPDATVAIAQIQAMHEFIQKDIKNVRSPELNKTLVRLVDSYFKLEKISKDLLSASGVLNSQKRTAVFYDIENLVQGMKNQRLLNDFSIKDIVDAILNADTQAHISVQKAFADWSNHKLETIHYQINSLGIEPVQALGLSSSPASRSNTSKNASDFQLVIEAIKLANTNPFIQNYVIVSGDGGFTALTRYLQGMGKTVVGCGYEKSSSDIFKAACNQFVNLQRRHGGSDWDDINAEIAAKLSRESLDTPQDINTFVRSVLEAYRTSPKAIALFKEEGQDLSVFKVFLQTFIPEIDHHIKEATGSKLFKQYMHFICQESEFCVARLKRPMILAITQSLPDGAVIDPLPRALSPNNDGSTVPVFNPHTTPIKDPINKRLMLAFKPIDTPISQMEMDVCAKQLLKWYLADPESSAKIEAGDFKASIFYEALQFMVPGIEKSIIGDLGFGSFQEYLRYLCADTQVAIATSDRKKDHIVSRTQPPALFTLLDSLEPRNPHSPETYRTLLSRGKNGFEIVEPEVWFKIIVAVTAFADYPQALPDISQAIYAESESEYSMTTLKLATLSLKRLDFFIVHADQSVSLKPGFKSIALAIEVIRSELTGRLSYYLGSVDPAVLEDLLPKPAIALSNDQESVA